MVQIKKLEWKPSFEGKWLRAKGLGRTYEVRANSKDLEELQSRAQAEVEAIIQSWLVDDAEDGAAGRNALDKEREPRKEPRE